MTVEIERVTITDLLNGEFGGQFIEDAGCDLRDEYKDSAISAITKLYKSESAKKNVPYIIKYSKLSVGYICMEGDGISAIFVHPGWRQEGIASTAVGLVLIETGLKNTTTTVQAEDQSVGFWSNLGYNISKGRDSLGLTLMEADKMNVIRTDKHELINYGENDMEKKSNIVVNNEYGEELSFETLTFNGGEEHIRFLSDLTEYDEDNEFRITARLKSSKDIMQLLLVTDALRRGVRPKVLTCFIPYMPYARQDRVCNDGESLSVAVMAQLINSCKFDRVDILDPHSDVVGALINNISITDQTTLLRPIALKSKDHGYTIVSPDAGATKKAMGVARAFNSPIVEASKVRETKSGNIIATEVHGDVTGQDCLIVDDICDGGRTFIELAKKLKVRGAKSVALFATHGIFSKGLNVLKAYIDQVYTTNSFCDLESDDFLHVHEVL